MHAKQPTPYQSLVELMDNSNNLDVLDALSISCITSYYQYRSKSIQLIYMFDCDRNLMT